jgi:hypothetical protein
VRIAEYEKVSWEEENGKALQAERTSHINHGVGENVCRGGREAGKGNCGRCRKWKSSCMDPRVCVKPG